jgi:hypothetical protein
MKSRIAIGVFLALGLLIGLTGHWMFADTFHSGPQVGEKLFMAFLPLHANGPNAGKRVCLI